MMWLMEPEAAIGFGDRVFPGMRLHMYLRAGKRLANDGNHLTEQRHDDNAVPASLIRTTHSPLSVTMSACLPVCVCVWFLNEVSLVSEGRPGAEAFVQKLDKPL